MPRYFDKDAGGRLRIGLRVSSSEAMCVAVSGLGWKALENGEEFDRLRRRGVQSWEEHDRTVGGARLRARSAVAYV